MQRVVWQYRSAVLGPWGSELLAAPPLSPAASLFSDLRLLGEPEPVFDRPPLVLRQELLATTTGNAPDEAADLAAYHHAFVADGETAAELARRLAAESTVRAVEIQGRPEPALAHGPANSRFPRMASFLSLTPRATPDFLPCQGHLAPAPHGIDAPAAWRRPGGSGRDVRLIDLEDGWNLTHESLLRGQVGLLAGVPREADHGTAVLGLLAGTDGVTGIVPEATFGVVSSWTGSPARRWNAASAIEKATRFLAAGDVLLIGLHVPGPHAHSSTGCRGFLPLEYGEAERAAIRAGVARGIHVVAAAGNGSEDLDQPAYHGRLDRTGDSGSILVGGGASQWQPAPHSRLLWSNWGSRLDLQGWGCDLVTAGGRELGYHDLFDHPEASRCYTQTFAGTSGAAPLVAGAVACLSGCLRAAGRPPLPPAEMRQLLIETGQRQTASLDAPVQQHIGPLPDLAAALTALGL